MEKWNNFVKRVIAVIIPYCIVRCGNLYFLHSFQADTNIYPVNAWDKVIFETIAVFALLGLIHGIVKLGDKVRNLG